MPTIMFGKRRQSEMYARDGTDRNVIDESIVAYIETPATYQGMRWPPLKNALGSFLRRMKTHAISTMNAK